VKPEYKNTHNTRTNDAFYQLFMGLTLSSPVVSNGYTSKCSELYWSNTPYLLF